MAAVFLLHSGGYDSQRGPTRRVRACAVFPSVQEVLERPLTIALLRTRRSLLKCHVDVRTLTREPALDLLGPTEAIAGSFARSKMAVQAGVPSGLSREFVP